MRAYELKIGNNGEYGKWVGGLKNNTALNIRFNINAYNDALSTSIPNTIEIFNLPLKYFMNADTYIGKPIYLSAGFDKSVLALKAGYSDVGCRLIYYGTILNVVPNYSDLTNPSILFAMMMGSTNQHTGNNSQQIEGSITTIDNGKLNKEKLGLWLKNFIPQNFIIKFDNSVNNLILQSTQTQIMSASNLSEALAQLEDLNLFAYTYSNELHLNYKKQTTGTTRTTQTKSKGHYGTKQLGNNFYEITGLQVEPNLSDLPKIKVEDIIGMPQIINPVSIQITLGLKPDFYVGSVVVLPKDLIKATINDTSFGGVVALQGKMKIFTGGTFKVVGVNHVGEYFNPNPEAWVTSLMLVANN